MAKFARRSVASNPSSLTSINSSWSFSSSLSPISSTAKIIPSSSYNKAKFGENSYHQKRSSILSSSSNNINKNLPSSSLPATPDPLRTTNYQLTTRTISTNYNRNGSTAGNQNSSIHRNDSKFYNNYNTNTTLSSKNTTATDQNYNNSLSAADLLAAERERIRMEFYATYDVMTGVRIAATLGGFFGLMVFLVVYKSRSHSDETLKVLKDPKIAAVAAACMQEEEEREIQEAIEATGLSIYPDEYEHMMFRRQRMLSLGNVSAPPILHRYRFSSIGGGPYSSLLESGRRYSYSGGRRRSGSESSRILGTYHMGSSFGTDDYFIETDDELENEYENNKDKENDSVHPQGFLGVPPAGQESRRSSAMTCCSTESSYLERRCSALNLGLMELPTTTERRISSVSRRSSADIWDYYYPDIQIIQATPKQSPCLSERSVHDRTTFISTTTASAAAATTTMTTSTTKNSSIIKSPIMTTHSITTTATTSTETAAITNGSSSYYGQYNKIFPKSDDFYRCHHDSFIEKRKICHTLSADSSIKINRKYDDTNELKLIVERKISDPSSIMNNNNNNYNNNNLNSNNYNNYNNNSYNNLYTSSYDSLKLLRNHESDVVKRAPLASLSSFKISSIDYQDSDLKSLGSDSVFVESYADTDDDMEQFSTDSDELSGSLCGDDDNNEAVGLQSQPLPVSLQLQSLSSNLQLHKQKQQQPVSIRKTSSILMKQQQQQQQKLGDYSQRIKQQQISTKSEPCSIKTDEHRYRKHQSNYNSKRIRATLERHRTQSASSNDRILLISSSQQSSQEQPSTSSLEHNLPSTSEYYNQRELPTASSSATYHHHHPHPHHLPSTTLIHQQQQLPLSAATGSLKTASNTSDETLKGYGHGANGGGIGVGGGGGGGIGVGGGGGGGGTSTGTTTSSCSSSQKTEIYRPSPVPVIRSGSASSSGIITRTSSFSYDNNKDSFSNRSGISSKRYYSSRKHHQQQQQQHQHQINDDNDDDDDDDYDDDQSKLSTSSNNSNNECVEVNVIIENRPIITATTATNIISSSSSPSVILELPVITTTTAQTVPHLSQVKDDDDDPPRDPSLPGTSRKWSKETLF